MSRRSSGILSWMLFAMRAEDTAAFGLKLTDLFAYMWHLKY